MSIRRDSSEKVLQILQNFDSSTKSVPIAEVPLLLTARALHVFLLCHYLASTLPNIHGLHFTCEKTHHQNSMSVIQLRIVFCYIYGRGERKKYISPVYIDQNAFDKRWLKHQSSILELLRLVGNKKSSVRSDIISKPNKVKNSTFSPPSCDHTIPDRT